MTIYITNIVYTAAEAALQPALLQGRERRVRPESLQLCLVKVEDTERVRLVDLRNLRPDHGE